MDRHELSKLLEQAELQASNTRAKGTQVDLEGKHDEAESYYAAAESAEATIWDLRKQLGLRMRRSSRRFIDSKRTREVTK